MPTLRAKNGVVHSLVIDEGDAEWTTCFEFMTRTEKRDYFEGQRGPYPVTCFWCIASISKRTGNRVEPRLS